MKSIYQNYWCISELNEQEIEKKIFNITNEITEKYQKISCPAKFMAMKLLENDEHCLKNIQAVNQLLVATKQLVLTRNN